MTTILLWLFMEKLLTGKFFTRNKQEYSKKEVKPLKRRNLNPIVVPDDVDHFTGIMKA